MFDVGGNAAEWVLTADGKGKTVGDGELSGGGAVELHAGGGLHWLLLGARSGESAHGCDADNKSRDLRE